MRIAIFSVRIDPRDGYGNITVELCRALHALGQEFTLFVPKTEQKYVEAIQLPFPVQCVLPPPYFRVWQKTALQHLSVPDVSAYDLVHSLFDFPYCVLAARAAKKYHKPFIMGAQGTYGVLPLTFFPEKYLLQWSYAQAKHVLVPSQFTKEMIQKYSHKQYPIRVVHNGVNLSRFLKQSSELARWQKHFQGKTVLLTVGGLKPRKGQDLIIRALPEIRKVCPTAHYVLVGDSPWRATLEKLSQDADVSSNVEFLGIRDGDDLTGIFQACDLYVHTPRVANLQFEGFGIVYLEAGACAKASVATDAGGIRDAVIDGKTGVIVPSEDVSAISNAVIDLLQNPEKRERLGKEGRRYAEKHAWSAIAEQFISYYRESVL